MKPYENDAEWILKMLVSEYLNGFVKKLEDVVDLEGCKICTSYHDEESWWKGRKKRKLVKSQQNWASEDNFFKAIFNSCFFIYLSIKYIANSRKIKTNKMIYKNIHKNQKT